MKKLILTAVVALMAAAGSAKAQLGWTLTRCINNFGTPQQEYKWGVVDYYWVTDGLAVTVMPNSEGIIDCIAYGSPSLALIKAYAPRLLRENVSGNWVLFDDGKGKATIATWHNSTYGCYAVLEPLNNGWYRLMIATDSFSDRLPR